MGLVGYWILNKRWRECFAMANYSPSMPNRIFSSSN